SGLVEDSRAGPFSARGEVNTRDMQRRMTVRHIKLAFWAAVAAIVVVWLPASVHPQSKPLPKGAYAKNVEFVSFTENGGRIPFKMSLHQAGARWFLYAGSQNDRGWTVLDVTNPADTAVLNWIPGPANTRTGQLDVADGKMITALER